jgi:hypothetical protein
MFSLWYTFTDIMLCTYDDDDEYDDNNDNDDMWA